MKIIKIKSWDDNFCGSRKDEEALLKEHGCRWITPDEFFDFYKDEEYDKYFPCHVMTPLGSVLRGDVGFYDGRYVDVGVRFGGRRGVLGVLLEKEKVASSYYDGEDREKAERSITPLPSKAERIATTSKFEAWLNGKIAESQKKMDEKSDEYYRAENRMHPEDKETVLKEWATYNGRHQAYEDCLVQYRLTCPSLLRNNRNKSNALLRKTQG